MLFVTESAPQGAPRTVCEEPRCEHLVMSVARMAGVTKPQQKSVVSMAKSRVGRLVSSHLHGADLNQNTITDTQPISSHDLLCEVNMRKEIGPPYYFTPEGKETRTLKIKRLPCSFLREYDSFIWSTTFSFHFITEHKNVWKMYISVLLGHPALCGLV